MPRFRQQPTSVKAWPITALAKDYPRGWHVSEHRHRRGQLVYAKSGVMNVTTREGIWIVPPQRALWIPLGMEHEIRMEGRVAVRMLYLDRASSALFGSHCKVLSVSALLRELILAAAKAHAAMHGRDFVLPDDVDALAVSVLAHRLVPTSRAVGGHDRDGGPLIDAIVRRVVSETPVPVGSARRE